MIYGIGTDICDIRRIRASVQRWGGERFAQKILADGEMATWQARSARNPERGVRFIATRFCAKEAFSKAIGIGMRPPMAWRDCEIAHAANGSGQPVVVLHGALKAWFDQQQLSVKVSMSDEADYASSFVVVEKS